MGTVPGLPDCSDRAASGNRGRGSCGWGKFVLGGITGELGDEVTGDPEAVVD